MQAMRLIPHSVCGCSLMRAGASLPLPALELDICAARHAVISDVRFMLLCQTVSSCDFLTMSNCLAVTNLSRARRIKRRGFDAVLTLEDPSCAKRNQLRFHVKPAPDHLIMHFEDIDDDEYDYAIATEDDVKAIIDFGCKHVRNSILIHCFHGIGRSGGAALAILTDQLCNAHLALDALLSIKPDSVPNLRVARLADAVLKTDGAIIAALDEWTEKTPSVADFRQQKRAFFKANKNLYSLSATHSLIPHAGRESAGR